MPTLFCRALTSDVRRCTPQLLAATLLFAAVSGCQPTTSSIEPVSLGGTVSGLSADGLVIANGSETMNIGANATQFTFVTKHAPATPYTVTIQDEPDGVTCSIANGNGVTSSADVSNVAITCNARSYLLGGTVTGLTQSGLVLAVGNESLNVSSGATAFGFATPIAFGAPYAVSVQSAPLGLICSVANGSATMGTANANNVVVTCSQEAHSLGGTITGLTQSGLVIANGAEQVNVPSGATTFTLPNLVATTSSYAVTVLTQPTGLACTITGGIGTMGTANVSVTVSCTSRNFTLGGTVSGLVSSGLVLSNGGELLPIAASATTFTFANSVLFATNYSVSVATQPTGLTCSVSAGAAAMPAANVNDVAVTCSSLSYSVGGTISGLTGSGLVLANGSATLAVAANATNFTFPTLVAYGSPYSVTVDTQPTNMLCSVSNGSGTVPASAVTDVSITCSTTAYMLGGTISGLTAGGLILTNSTDRLSVAANAGVFSMPSGVAVGSPYNVTIAAHPAGMNCSVTNASGTMGSADVTNVSIACISRQWTWVKGLNTVGGNGNYGSKGVAAVGNVPPPRNSAMTWTDAAGNLWLFGGAGRVSGSEGDLSDLWKYDVTTQLWTWVHGSNTRNGAGTYGAQGISAGSNEPRSRHEAITWVDANGKFWLFGGYSDAAIVFGLLNDLWRYDPLTNEWTWMGGSSSPNAAPVHGTKGVAASGNDPGARIGPVSWRDSTGKLWLLGGRAPNGDHWNDLWSYDLVTQWWTWESGSNTGNAAGIYGTKGVAASTTVPGGRVNAMSAVSGTNHLLLFAGYGYDENAAIAFLNDLWSFNLTTKQWTWLGGSTTNSAAGVYGTRGLPAASNAPGARFAGLGWTDTAGRFWTFGGYGANDTGGHTDHNDLWMFDLGTQQWTWVNGSASGNSSGVYGTINVAAPSNSPGSRLFPSGWIDASNRIWVFGGYGRDSVGSRYKLSDLWMY